MFFYAVIDGLRHADKSIANTNETNQLKKDDP